MAAGTVYLDVDDEITSAASRIRSSDSTKVALVVPYGSRISTSRMNFRLLSREAVVNNRRLSIIAGDPATRALAASAGLPVFATVAEYDSAVAGPPAPENDEVAGPAAPIVPAIAAADATDSSPPARTTKRRRPRAPVADETQSIVLPAAAAAAAAVAAAGGAAAVPPAGPAYGAGDSEPALASEPWNGGSTGRLPVRRAVGRFRVETPVLVGGAAVVLALLVVAVGALFILPAADITVTPRQEAIGPIPLTVTANPDATAVDPANATVPAIRLDIPVDVTETFPTAGKRIELKAATGAVTFSNYDPTASNTIAVDSIVATEGGLRFKTLATITLPKATFVFPPGNITPSKQSVAVQAVKAGPAGNVPANAIRVVPQGENPDFLKVNNPDPTTGGAKDEFPRIDQKDIDRALAALRLKLDEAFTAAVSAGGGAPAGTTLFPETATPGVATPTIDPATLLGQEVATFDLGLRSSGTVIAVDASPVQKIAEARLLASVGSGYHLVDGSIRVDQGKPVVTAGVVTFPVTASAARVRVLDPEALRALVKGQSIDQAKTLLKPFGDVTIDTWPAWVSSITGFDARLTVTVGRPAAIGSGPGSSGAPSSISPRSSTGSQSKSPSASTPANSPAASTAP